MSTNLNPLQGLRILRAIRKAIRKGLVTNVRLDHNNDIWFTVCNVDVNLFENNSVFIHQPVNSFPYGDAEIVGLIFAAWRIKRLLKRKVKGAKDVITQSKAKKPSEVDRIKNDLFSCVTDKDS